MEFERINTEELQSELRRLDLMVRRWRGQVENWPADERLQLIRDLETVRRLRTALAAQVREVETLSHQERQQAEVELIPVRNELVKTMVRAAEMFDR